ncbi:MAG: family 20 glycosylhydrolase [Planctomycetota bacterium]
MPDILEDAMLDSGAAAGLERLALLPFPRQVSLRGAPFRPAPSNFLFLSPDAASGTRRKCFLLAQQLAEEGLRTSLEASSSLGPTQALFTQSASFPKWDKLEAPLRGQAAGREGYRLVVTSDGALLYGADEQGVQYAGATLRQLLQDGPVVPGLEIEDYPLLPARALHLDFKGWPPTAEHLKTVIGILAGLKINTLLLEYAAHFNFPSQPGLAAEGSLTALEVGELEVYARDLGVTLVPLVPCLGNVGHVLRLPAYTSLREHPQYLQQYCPVNPQTLGVVTAMMEDLIAVHAGKFFHAGGDETQMLGSNPATAARAAQLGGRSALYLEYVGKVCRYLLTCQREPMLWDDMFRKMSDAQVQWLPEEVVLTSWQYEGHGGRATPAILANLDRYKRLRRRVWGVAMRSPALRYDAFDNIDAWTEAAELGYVEGVITTAWTRDHPLGALFPPPETAWPAAFYAAERAWSGMKGLGRERFPRRFVVRMFGAKDPAAQSRVWAGFDFLLREHARRAREFFAQDARAAPRGGSTLAFMEAWSGIRAFQEYVRQFEEQVSGSYANLQAGQGDPFHSGRLRWRVLELKNKLPALVANFRQQAARITTEAQIREFVESSIAYSYGRLEEIEKLLAQYPLPPQEWQQPVSL